MESVEKAWSRDDALIEVHQELHAYLSGAARHSSLTAVVDEIWRLEPDFRQRMLAVHVLTSPETSRALDASESYVRRAAPAQTRVEREFSGLVQGAVNWPKTVQRRLATSDRTLFVTRPTERVYDTHALRLVRALLHRIAALSKLVGKISGPGVAEDIRLVVERARDMSNGPKLRARGRLEGPDLATSEAIVRRSPELAPVLALHRSAQEVLSGRSPSAMVAALLGGVFAPVGDPELFELWVGFRILAAARARGAMVEPAPIVAGEAERAFARISVGGRVWDMWWQRTYWKALGRGASGAYSRILADAGLRQSSLRPDFLLVSLDPEPKMRLIEVKHSVGSTAADRTGITDCLAYLRDLQDAEAGIEDVHCLVVSNTTRAQFSAGLVGVTSPGSLTSDEVAAHLFG
jgi:hypothetical protein